MKTFANFAVSGQFVKVLTAKLLTECGGIIINRRVINWHVSDNKTHLDNGDSIQIADVASLSVARQYFSDSSFPNLHVDMVASNNGLHFVTLQLTHLGSCKYYLVRALVPPCRILPTCRFLPTL